MRIFSKSSPIALLALLTGSVLLFVGGPDQHAWRLWQVLWNLGHLPFFVLLGFWVWSFCWEFRSLSWLGMTRYALFLLLMGLIAFSTEVIQRHVGRDYSLNDMLTDEIAAFLVLLWKLKLKSTTGRMLLALMAITLLIWVTLPLSRTIYDEWLERSQFPLLAGFETKSEMSRWHCGRMAKRSENASFNGSKGLEFEVNPTGYSGCSFQHFPQDWSHYRWLSFELWSPKSGLKITIRINDRFHWYHGQHYADRFDQTLILNQGWNARRLNLRLVQKTPSGRMMNMSEIVDVGWFVSSPGHVERFYLDDVRLKK